MTERWSDGLEKGDEVFVVNQGTRIICPIMRTTPTQVVVNYRGMGEWKFSKRDNLKVGSKGIPVWSICRIEPAQEN